MHFSSSLFIIYIIIILVIYKRENIFDFPKGNKYLQSWEIVRKTSSLKFVILIPLYVPQSWSKFNPR